MGWACGSWVLVQVAGWRRVGRSIFSVTGGYQARQTRQAGMGMNCPSGSGPTFGTHSLCDPGRCPFPLLSWTRAIEQLVLILCCHRQAQGQCGTQSTASVSASVTSRSLSLSPVDLRMLWMDLLSGILTTGPMLLFWSAVSRLTAEGDLHFLLTRQEQQE